MFIKKKNLVFWFCAFLIISFLFTGCFFLPFGTLYVSSIPDGAQIFLNDTYTGHNTPFLISNLIPGSYLLKLVLEDESISREETVIISQGQKTSVHLGLTNLPDYRALCIGVGKYLDPGIPDLRAPAYDVDRMKIVFENSNFGEKNITFKNIKTLIDGQSTRFNILNSIDMCFSEADNNDISYLYFSGHGYSDGETSTILPYNALDDSASKDISTDELAMTLAVIPGTKVVILDSCNSGGFIGKGTFKRGMVDDNNLAKFNENVLQSFALYDEDEAILEKNNLASGGFKVIVSAAGDQDCYETLYHLVDGNPFGYFSASLCEGCGYNDFTSPFPADYNNNREITLNEIHQYVKNSLTSLKQDTQVYPSESSFVFIEY